MLITTVATLSYMTSWVNCTCELCVRMMMHVVSAIIYGINTSSNSNNQTWVLSNVMIQSSMSGYDSIWWHAEVGGVVEDSVSDITWGDYHGLDDIKISPIAHFLFPSLLIHDDSHLALIFIWHITYAKPSQHMTIITNSTLLSLLLCSFIA